MLHKKTVTIILKNMEHIKALCEQSVEMCHVNTDGTYRDHLLQRVKRVYITVINVSVYAQSFK